MSNNKTIKEIWDHIIKKHTEEAVQQERERILNGIEKYRERVGVPNGFDEKASINKGYHRAYDLIIQLINEES